MTAEYVTLVKGKFVQSVFIERNTVLAQPKSISRKLSNKYEKNYPKSHRKFSKTASEIAGLKCA